MNKESILCPWEPAEFLVFSSNVPELVHYSHGIAGILAIGIGLLVFLNNPKNIIGKFFLLFMSLVALWIFLDSVLWATNIPGLVMFNWSLQVLIEPLVFASAFYLFYYFVKGKTPKFKLNIIISLLILPFIIFLPTNLNLQGLWLSICESIEGPLASHYSYIFNIIMVILITILAFRDLPKLKKKTERASGWLFYFGLLIFLSLFISGNIISSITENWELSQYGLFGLPIFAALLAYSMVKFQAFNTKVVGAQVLVITLVIAVGGLLFIVKSDLSRIVSLITLAITITVGGFLVKSIKKEIQQREEIEKLAGDLERTNERLKVLDKQKSEFVSIASHQLRSPLTAIRGYISMMQEGSYGVLPEAMKDVLKRIDDSSRFMATSIDDFLNVSRIESGNMKYEYTDINLTEMTRQVVEDLQSDAEKRQLQLLFRTDLEHPDAMVHADHGKTMQILHNLINNALKYTKVGSVTVCMKDDPSLGTITVEIIDTGIGMSKETLIKLFGKFTRAKIASSSNIMGTGLGLFVAREMARAMKGDIVASSEGEGKGSKFIFTMPYKALANNSDVMTGSKN